MPDPAFPPTLTPLVQSRIPALSGSWLKFEGANPSGSFKDRVMQVLVGEAVAAGARGAVVASSGNAAVAAASHSARAGLPLLVLVPERVPEQIIPMLRHRGATVIRAGEGPAAVYGLAKRVADQFNIPNLASTFAASGCEWACRSIGWEIAEQLPSHEVRTLAAAVSVGPVLYGASQGLREAGRALPRMVAGQAAGCAPIARAFDNGSTEVEAWNEPVQTRATSIADRLAGYSGEATFFLNAVRIGGGVVASADDSELQEIRTLLARHDGLDVELSSCAAVAALIRSGFTGADAVCILTAAGTRETLAGAFMPQESPDLNHFFQRVNGNPSSTEEVERWINESRS